MYVGTYMEKKAVVKEFHEMLEEDTGLMVKEAGLLQGNCTNIVQFLGLSESPPAVMMEFFFSSKPFG